MSGRGWILTLGLVSWLCFDTAAVGYFLTGDPLRGWLSSLLCVAQMMAWLRDIQVVRP